MYIDVLGLRREHLYRLGVGSEEQALYVAKVVVAWQHVFPCYRQVTPAPVVLLDRPGDNQRELRGLAAQRYPVGVDLQLRGLR